MASDDSNTARAKKDWGSGLRLSATDIEDHPSGPPKHGGVSQGERAFNIASTFLSGVLAISGSQFIGAPLKMINPEYYDAYMAFTKQSFAVLMTSMTQWWAPTVVRVSGDASMKGQMHQMPDGTLKCNFPHRITLMANHQLYTDWLYLWWIAYTNGMHGRIHIIMKESLKNIPFLGWGAQFYNFIFVARKWEQDKTRFQQHLQKLNQHDYPMWLLIFPEGTNLSKVTRETSKKWADKNGLQDMKHQLLPRSTGLRFCLEQLRETTPWLYDCTIAYEGVPPGEFGQDIFTLRSSFLEGRPPKSVNMHWRRFHVNDIPVDDEKAFEVWLRNRWREKDYLLEYFVRHNRFPSDVDWLIKGENKTREAPYIETQVKSGNWEEFLMIFAPVTAFVMVLFLFYGASSGSLLKQMEQVAKQATDGAGGIPSFDLRNMPSEVTDLFQQHMPSEASALLQQRPRASSVASSSRAPSVVSKAATAPLSRPKRPAAPARRGSTSAVFTANGIKIQKASSKAPSTQRILDRMGEPEPISVTTANGIALKIAPKPTETGIKMEVVEAKRPQTKSSPNTAKKATATSKPAAKASSASAQSEQKTVMVNGVPVKINTSSAAPKNTSAQAKPAVTKTPAAQNTTKAAPAATASQPPPKPKASAKPAPATPRTQGVPPNPSTKATALSKPAAKPAAKPTETTTPKPTPKPAATAATGAPNKLDAQTPKKATSSTPKKGIGNTTPSAAPKKLEAAPTANGTVSKSKAAASSSSSSHSAPKLEVKKAAKPQANVTKGGAPKKLDVDAAPRKVDAGTGPRKLEVDSGPRKLANGVGTK